MVEKVNVFRPQAVGFHKLLVPWRPLVLGVAREHALQAHANALNILYWAPALLAEEVQADDAVAVDVRVHGDLAFGGGGDGEGYFWWFCGFFLLGFVWKKYSNNSFKKNKDIKCLDATSTYVNIRSKKEGVS